LLHKVIADLSDAEAKSHKQLIKVWLLKMQQLHLKLEYIFTKEIGISNHEGTKAMPGIALTASPEAPLLQQTIYQTQSLFSQSDMGCNWSKPGLMQH
jgi:hypothetical protein